MAGKRLRIEKHATGPGGRGFAATLHSAYLDGELVGEWIKGGMRPWAGPISGPILLGRYEDWRSAIAKLEAGDDRRVMG